MKNFSEKKKKKNIQRMCVHQYQKMNEVRYTKEREPDGSHRMVEHSRGGGRMVMS